MRSGRFTGSKRLGLYGLGGAAACLAILSAAWACTVLIGHNLVATPASSSCVDTSSTGDSYECTPINVTVQGHNTAGNLGDMSSFGVYQNVGNPGLAVGNEVGPCASSGADIQQIGSVTYTATATDPLDSPNRITVGNTLTGSAEPQVAPDTTHPANSVWLYRICAAPEDAQTNMLFPIAKIGDSGS